MERITPSRSVIPSAEEEVDVEFFLAWGYKFTNS